MSGVFQGLLQAHSVLLLEEDCGQANKYQTWLADAGAMVTCIRSVRAGSDLIAERSYGFDIAVLACPATPDAPDSVLSLARELRRRQPACALLIQGPALDPELFQRLRALGARFLSKTAGHDDFMFTVCKLSEPEVPDLRVLAEAARRTWHLSEQQARLFYYNLWSFSNQEIALALGLSLHTVQDYQHDLRRKIGANSKSACLRRLLESIGVQAPRLRSMTRHAAQLL